MDVYSLSYLKKNKIIFNYLLVLFFVFYITFYLIFKHSLLYMLSDAYYYSSIAENLFNLGVFRSATMEPSLPVVTTQNGIVFIHYAFIWLGVHDPVIRMYMVSGLCFVALLGSLWILRLIFIKRLGCGEGVVVLLLFTLVLNPVWYLGLLQPINDVFFVFLSFSYIYLFLAKGEKSNKELFLMAVIAVLVGHFRVQGAFLFVASILVSILLKKYRHALQYCFLLFVSLLSIQSFTSFFIEDKSGLRKTAELVKSNLSIPEILTTSYSVFKSILPNLFLGFDIFSEYYYWFFVLIITYSFIYLFISLRSKEIQNTFLMFFLMMNLFFVMVFPWQTPRYLLVILPFIAYYTSVYTSALASKNLFLIVYNLFLFCALIFRIMFLDGSSLLGRVPNINFDINYTVNKINSEKFSGYLGGDYDLVSYTYQGRVSHFLFNKPSVNYNDTTNENIVYVGSPSNFLNFKSTLKRRQIFIVSEEDQHLEFNLRHGFVPEARLYTLKVVYPPEFLEPVSPSLL